MRPTIFVAFFLTAGAYLYPDPRLPQLPTAANDARRVAELERALEKTSAELARAQTTTGVLPRAGDTINLRLSLGLWLALGGASIVRLRSGEQIPALSTLALSLIGGSIALYELLRTLIDAATRALGFGPPKMRCFKCMTIFEHTKGGTQAVCPQCGTTNAVAQGTSRRLSAFS